ncbi:hypothetical protein RB653_003770 [Dictyostelium firmibasis]|uniref:Uncharacterized protein n=1 Tax=Dictyostelium firmibasis TaxID=79012 RepID=A0AAN7YZE8_9MYCE
MMTISSICTCNGWWKTNSIWSISISINSGNNNSIIELKKLNNTRQLLEKPKETKKTK